MATPLNSQSNFVAAYAGSGPGENLAGDPGTERGMLKRLELAIFSVHYRFIGCVGEPPHFLARFGIGKQCLVG
jgi:hypothetical protein